MSSIAQLLMRQGEIAAEGSRRSGEIWGGAINNLGQIAGGAIDQHMAGQKKKREVEEMGKRDAAWTAVVESWDGKDPRELHAIASRMFDPKTALQMTQAVVSFHQMAGKGDDEDLAHAYNIAGALTSGKISPQQWERWGSGIQQKVRPVVERIFGSASSPEDQARTAERDPMGMEAQEQPWSYEDAIEGARALLTLKAEKERRTKVVGDTLVDEDTGQAVYTEPDKAPKGPTVGSFEDYVTQKFGARPTPAQISQARKEYQQADDRLPPAPTLSPTAESNIINRLSNQWSKAAAPAVEVARQVKLMDAGLEAARRGDMAAGSQAVLVTFQKILDPTSVVRESEYERSAAGQALMSRVQGAYEKLVQGGAGVPLKDLDKFARLAREASRAFSTGYLQSEKKRILFTADRYKIPHEAVVADLDLGGEADAPKPREGGQGGSALQVQAPDGNTYTFATQAEADNFRREAGIK
jgi:hypothetical protein